MARLQDLFNSFRTISSVRPEQKALPQTSYKPLLQEFAMKEGHQKVMGMGQSSRAFRAESGIRNYQRNRKAARRDTGFALPIEIGNLLVSHRAATERDKIAAEQRKRDQEIADQYAELQQMVADYPKAFREIYKHGAPAAEIPHGMLP